MKQVVFLASLCVYSLLLGVVAPFSGTVSAQPTLQVSQTILPLQCTVDIVTVGSTYEVRLTPAKCSRLPEARELLREAYLQYPQ
ncbi:MAG: hypothetical protein WAS36_00775 [Candidatus Saccharimonadales bacterium]